MGDVKVRTFKDLLELAVRKIYSGATVLEEAAGNLIVSTGLQEMHDGTLEVLPEEGLIDGDFYISYDKKEVDDDA